MFVWVVNIVAHYILYVGGELGWLINDLEDLQYKMMKYYQIMIFQYNVDVMLRNPQ